MCSWTRQLCFNPAAACLQAESALRALLAQSALSPAAIRQDGASSTPARSRLQVRRVSWWVPVRGGGERFCFAPACAASYAHAVQGQQPGATNPQTAHSGPTHTCILLTHPQQKETCMLRHTPHQEPGHNPKDQRRHWLCLADGMCPVSRIPAAQRAAHDAFTSAACPGPDIPSIPSAAGHLPRHRQHLAVRVWPRRAVAGHPCSAQEPSADSVSSQLCPQRP